jgi:Protein of unknown function (DUF429)
VTPTAARIVAIDWSGDLRNARRKIWIAEVVEGRLLRLECGRGRDETVDWLLAAGATTPDLIVGLDFAFSFPAWFLRTRGHTAVRDLWLDAATHCEDWLASCTPPFWGRPQRGRPSNTPEHFRATEKLVPSIAGIRPKSVFQIGGGGAVGTGSVRGMAALHRLSAGGFSIWPFDIPRTPLVIEIYPRLLTDAVTKSSQRGRREYLAARFPTIPTHLAGAAASCEDAFDAAVSALVMAARADQIVMLSKAADPERLLEGEIWYPR